ncbi:MAG: adenylate cyclase [Paracoccaceae bacterium]|jgi:adenylate cyclase
MTSDSIVDWLLSEAPTLPSFRHVLEGLIAQLNAEGFEFHRAVLGIGVLHPELMAKTYTWERGASYVAETEIHHGIEATDQYLDSPFRLLNEGEPFVRQQLTGPGSNITYEMLEEQRDAGATDYIAIGLPRSDGNIYRSSWTTDRDGGFTDGEIDRLLALRPAIGVIAELQSRAEMTKSVLALYLGREAGRRVYAGDIRRGDGNTIHSVLWMCDLRGFTALSDRIPLNDLIAVLNGYFEAVTGPIHASGGEVLKFIGDAVLGIFRIEDKTEIAEICERALSAAELAVANMHILNRRRIREDQDPLNFSIALHVGDAMYGNVGAHNRLDFTVIGPAVNLCARLEALAGGLGEKIICSSEFAAVSNVEMRSVGTHELKNVEAATEAFVPA